MDIKQFKLAADLLDIASEEFSNHVCNDIPDEIYRGWTIKERQSFVKEYHEWNGDPKEYDPDHIYLPDWAVMSFLAHKLKNQK